MSSAVLAAQGDNGVTAFLYAAAALIVAVTGLLTILLPRREAKAKAKQKANKKHKRQNWTASAPPEPPPPPPNETAAPASPDWYLRKQPELNTWHSASPATPASPVVSNRPPTRWWLSAGPAADPARDRSRGGQRV